MVTQADGGTSGFAGEIVSTRLIRAPRGRVFNAFSDPDRLARWWGPRGFVNEFQEFDFRPGGAWRFLMRGPDGTAYPMVKEFVEIVQPERITLLHPQEGHRFTMTMALADAEGGTALTWTMRFESPDECRRVRGAVVEANEQNFDRLEAELAAERTDGAAGAGGRAP